jgi:succinoglycan biosynthesis protein ExoU
MHPNSAAIPLRKGGVAIHPCPIVEVEVDKSAPEPVCVVIAAKNASATIGWAVASALREKRVGEVVVVDDGSSDRTAAAAREADDGSSRLRTISLGENRGPAFARNQAIQQSTAPLIAILDADDFFLEGRFDRLVDGDDWDFVADNILFTETGAEEPQVPSFAPEPSFLDLRAFVEGNITRRGKRRGEIGFLKPVMRRAFLEPHDLRYREELRLGEDYDLYARALAAGARYKIVRSCGYCAVVRPDSLSGRHTTDDLKRLWEADLALMQSSVLPRDARNVLKRHADQIRARYQLRRFLDVKASSGVAAAVIDASGRPMSLPEVAIGILSDKIENLVRRNRGRRQGSEVSAARYLLQARPIPSP